MTRIYTSRSRQLTKAVKYVCIGFDPSVEDYPPCLRLFAIDTAPTRRYAVFLNSPGNFHSHFALALYGSSAMNERDASRPSCANSCGTQIHRLRSGPRLTDSIVRHLRGVVSAGNPNHQRTPFREPIFHTVSGAIFAATRLAAILLGAALGVFAQSKQQVNPVACPPRFQAGYRR